MMLRTNTFALIGAVFFLSLVIMPPAARGKRVKGADARKDVKKKAAAKKKDAPLSRSDKAAEVYGAAMKIYKMGRWKDASKGIAGFIKGFKTNENIPLAHLQLAHCYYKLGDKNGIIKEIDTVIKKFPESKAAYFAWNKKLLIALKNREYDKFISIYGEVTKEWKHAPLSFWFDSDPLDWRKVGNFYWSFKNIDFTWPHHRTSGYNIKFDTDMHWAGDVLKAANNKKRAAKLLRIFESTFKKYKQSLPFDFLIKYSRKGYLIEYQGPQHYEPVDFAGKGEKWALAEFFKTKTKDRIKREYAKENNIPLLEIPYWEFDKIEKMLDEFLLSMSLAA